MFSWNMKCAGIQLSCFYTHKILDNQINNKDHSALNSDWHNIIYRGEKMSMLIWIITGAFQEGAYILFRSIVQ